MSPPGRGRFMLASRRDSPRQVLRDPRRTRREVLLPSTESFMSIKPGIGGPRPSAKTRHGSVEAVTRETHCPAKNKVAVFARGQHQRRWVGSWSRVHVETVMSAAPRCHAESERQAKPRLAPRTASRLAASAVVSKLATASCRYYGRQGDLDPGSLISRASVTHSQQLSRPRLEAGAGA